MVSHLSDASFLMFLRHLIFSALSFFTVNTYAQSTQDLCLRDFSAILLPDHSFSAHFSMQKFLPGLKQPLIGKGRVVAVPDQGLIWETISPLREIRVFGKNHVLTTDEHGKQTVRDIRDAGAISELLSLSRTDLIKSLQQSFFVSCRYQKNSYSVIISPKPGTLSEYLSEIAFEANTTALIRTTITQKNNSITRIEFDNATTPASVSENDSVLLQQVR